MSDLTTVLIFFSLSSHLLQVSFAFLAPFHVWPILLYIHCSIVSSGWCTSHHSDICSMPHTCDSVVCSLLCSLYICHCSYLLYVCAHLIPSCVPYVLYMSLLWCGLHPPYSLSLISLHFHQRFTLYHLTASVVTVIRVVVMPVCFLNMLFHVISCSCNSLFRPVLSIKN